MEMDELIGLFAVPGYSRLMDINNLGDENQIHYAAK
jgi:hypothetical protein